MVDTAAASLRPQAMPEVSQVEVMVIVAPVAILKQPVMLEAKLLSEEERQVLALETVQDSEVVEAMVELKAVNHTAAPVVRVILEEGLVVPRVHLLLRVAVVAAVEVVGAAVVASPAPQVSLLLAVMVTAAKVCLPVSLALQASRLAMENKATY